MATKSERILFLKNISILKGLNEEQISKVADICKEVSLDAGEYLMKEGDGGTSMYLFVKGEVEFSMMATMKIPKKGFEKAETVGGKLLPTYAPFIGDMALFEDAPRSATIHAKVDCMFYEITREDFQKLCDNDYHFAYTVLKNIIPVLSGRLRTSNQNVIKLTTLLSIVLSKKQR